MGNREDLFRVRINADERRMLDALAEADGLTASDVVRQLVRKAHTERFGTKQGRGGKAK